MKTRILTLWSVIIASAGAASCENFLEIGTPRTQLVTGSVFADQALADGAVNGIYHELMNNTAGFAAGGGGSVTALMDIYADQLEFAGSDANRLEMASGSVPAIATLNLNCWSSAYKAIFRANEALEGLAASTTLPEALVNRLRGESLFVRAFCHFYLVGLYGDVPLLVNSAYQTTSVQARAPELEVHARIAADLKEAADLLPSDDVHAQGERLRPTRWAALALLARICLYRGEWSAAIDYAESVMANGERFALVNHPDRVFLKESTEAIWQLRPVSLTIGAREAFDAIPASAGILQPTYGLSSTLLAVFESDDLRYDSWVAWHVSIHGSEAYSFPFKYKQRNKLQGDPYQEYTTVLRLTEQYLIRAEARAQSGNLAGAWADLNAVRRNHGGLPDLPNGSKEEFMEALERERRIEFFYEWGHRFFDLKRWGKIDAVLGAAKPGWKPTGKRLPIPQKEREANPFLTQNEGY